MKTKLLILAIASISLIAACKKNTTTTSAGSLAPNPMAIPIQSTNQTPIAMAGSANLAIWV